jgi:hypothetical protein
MKKYCETIKTVDQPLDSAICHSGPVTHLIRIIQNTRYHVPISILIRHAEIRNRIPESDGAFKEPFSRLDEERRNALLEPGTRVNSGPCQHLRPLVDV